LYAPDYVVNAGGVINIADELRPDGYNRERALRQVETIHDTVRRVFDVADEAGLTPAAAADHLAEARLASNSRA
jgi:leucine dehydrogenase